MTRGFIIGLFAGIVFGALGALMMTPMEGVEARSKVKEVVRVSRKRVGGVASRVQHRARPIKQSI